MAAPVTSVSNTVPITGRALNISDHFAAKCSVVVDSDYDTCGTITRASIAYLNKLQLDAIFTPGGLFADLDAWFKHSIEMRACGVQRFALYDWIMANADTARFRSALFPGVKAVSGPTILQPFIMAKQDSIVNRDHWKIASGFTTIGATTAPGNTMNSTYSQGGTTYTYNKVIVVTSRYGVPVNQAFFRPMDTLHIFNTASGAGGGTLQHGAWRVIDSIHSADQTQCFVAIMDINAPGGEGYDASPGQNNAAYMVPGINNVNDYEKWCNNRPTLDPRKMTPFWRQVSRMTRCVDSEYLIVYSRLMESNAAFRAFGDLPMAERNAQDELEEQKRFVNDFFYNKPLVNQDLTNWQLLDKINTVEGASTTLGIGSKIVAYRANFVGVREQLRLCAQVFDLVGNALNLYEWLDLNYAIMRARSTFLRRDVTEIDWFTNNVMRALFASAYTNYIANEFPGFPPRLVANYDQINKMGQIYDTYSFKYPGGVKINILSDFWFDDRLDQFQDIGQEAAGNVMWCLDIGKPKAGSIYWAHIAANRKTYRTADIDALAKIDSTFRCIMNTISIDQTLVSKEGTVVLECPLANAMVENIKLVIPTTTGKTKGVSGNYSYADLY